MVAFNEATAYHKRSKSNHITRRIEAWLLTVNKWVQGFSINVFVMTHSNFLNLHKLFIPNFFSWLNNKTTRIL